MNTLKHLNAAVAYLEEHLSDEISLEEASRLAGLSTDSFLRFFSYMTGMSVKDYLRRRRLSRAGEELLTGTERIIDLAVKYGYDSADAFSRAFARQHGHTPSALRKSGGPLHILPPASFHLIVKGAKEMDFRIIHLDETTVYGPSRPFDGQGYRSREELRNLMWADNFDDVPGQLCEGKWNQPGNRAYDGVWYGIWQNGSYRIARQRADVKSDAFPTTTLPAGTYAAFRTPPGGLAWEEFPKLFTLIFDSWLPSSGYCQKGDLAIEVLHLWTDHDRRQKERYFEVWIPVERK